MIISFGSINDDEEFASVLDRELPHFGAFLASILAFFLDTLRALSGKALCIAR